MVLQNRLEYGFSGDQVPAMPQFPKSAKRKRSVRKKVDGYRMCAFDLLATVAGQLLSESENSTVSLDCNNATPKVLIKQERLSSKQTFKVEAFDQQSCSQTVSDPKQISDVLKEHSQASSLTDSGPASLLVKSNASDDAGGSMTLNDGAKTCYPSCDVVDRHGASRKPLAFAKVQEEIGLTRPLELEYKSLGNGLKLDAQKLYCLDYPIDLDTKQPALLSSDSSTEVPACRSYLPCNSSMHNHESCMEQIVYMDDDDNFSGCTHPSIITNRASSPQCLADHGVRKLPASKYWKAAPSTLKYGQFANYDLGRKTILRGKKLFYTRQRAYLKRRKLFERCSIVSDGGFFHEDISNLCEKNRIKIEAQNAHTTALEVHDDLSTKMEQSSSYDSVKLSIKSFKVPELFVEIPETATVGSLKRTVLEAVTAILQGGLRVGVILQGKKVRDDNKTLCQVGISRRDKLDNLGFILEPSQTQTSPPLTSVGGPCFSLVDNSIEPLARNPPTTLSRDQASDATPRPVLTSCPESDHDSVHSPINASSTAANKLALVALPHINAEALAVVPLHKPRRSENVQRRIRRPFTVAEVEALVRAVEKLGTGRWRDVKLRDFDSAKHRTYVDLKDKWKTLVHTARISPQQRRGEPVPQELLDRVLSAHAYWSQQQARLTKSPACSSDTKQLSLPCPS